MTDCDHRHKCSQRCTRPTSPTIEKNSPEPLSTRLLLLLKENGQSDSLSLLPVFKAYLPPSHAIHVWRTRSRSRCLHLVPRSRILGSTLLCSHRGNTERHSYLTLRTALSSFFSTLFWNAQSNNTSGNHANMFVAMGTNLGTQVIDGGRLETLLFVGLFPLQFGLL